MWEGVGRGDVWGGVGRGVCVWASREGVCVWGSAPPPIDPWLDNLLACCAFSKRSVPEVIAQSTCQMRAQGWAAHESMGMGCT